MQDRWCKSTLANKESKAAPGWLELIKSTPRRWTCAPWKTCPQQLHFLLNHVSKITVHQSKVLEERVTNQLIRKHISIVETAQAHKASGKRIQIDSRLRFTQKVHMANQWKTHPSVWRTLRKQWLERWLKGLWVAPISTQWGSRTRPSASITVTISNMDSNSGLRRWI